MEGGEGRLRVFEGGRGEDAFVGEDLRELEGGFSGRRVLTIPIVASVLIMVQVMNAPLLLEGSGLGSKGRFEASEVSRRVLLLLLLLSPDDRRVVKECREMVPVVETESFPNES